MPSISSIVSHLYRKEYVTEKFMKRLIVYIVGSSICPMESTIAFLLQGSGIGIREGGSASRKIKWEWIIVLILLFIIVLSYTLTLNAYW